MFKSKPNNVTVHIGSEICLEAVVDNADTISWFHDGKLLRNVDEKSVIKFVNGKSTLRVKNVTKRDEGDYTCFAKSGTELKSTKNDSVYCHVSVIDGKIRSQRYILVYKDNLTHWALFLLSHYIT